MLNFGETIGQRIAVNNTLILRLERENELLQGMCHHENKIGRYGSDTGNWDKNDDDYWISCTCKDCGKTYNIYHSEDPIGYKNFTGEIKK